MPIQGTAYKMDVAYPGQITSRQEYTFIKGIQEEVINGGDEIIPFGSFVAEVPGGEIGEIMLPNAAGMTIVGVYTFSDIHERFADNSTGCPINKPAHKLYKGQVAFRAETDMVRGSTVFFRHTDAVTPGAFDQRGGTVRADADGGNADEVLNTSVVFDCKAGEVAIVNIDLSSLL